MLPLSNLSYSLYFIMGKDTERFSPSDLAALVWVLAGFLLYSLFPNKSEMRGLEEMEESQNKGVVKFVTEKRSSDSPSASLIN
jgi:hypothetical protein